MRAKATVAKDWRKQPRRAKARGADAAAVALGVHRTTLYRVLVGKSHNPELLARYNDLVRLRSKPTPTTI